MAIFEMPDELPTNPYATPDSCAARHKPGQSGVLLECDGCRRKTVKPLSACLRHPQLAIPCPECGTRHRLEFARNSQLRYHAAALPAIGLGVIAIWFALADQTYRTMDRLTTRGFRYFELSPSRSLIDFIVATTLLVLLLTPVLALWYWGFRAQLRMIATEGLLRKKTNRPSANSTPNP